MSQGKASNTFVQDLPVNKDNEMLILANAIRNPMHRDKFNNLVAFTEFRMEQTQALAWALIELCKGGYDPTPDSLYTKVQESPVKPTPSFDDINNMVTNFPDIGIKEFEEIHLNRLHEDAARTEGVKVVLNNVLKDFIDISVPLVDVRKGLNNIIETLDKAESKTKFSFTAISDIVPEIVKHKDNIAKMYTTGFDCLNTLIGNPLQPGTLTLIVARSSMGKSSLLLSILQRLSHMRIPTGLFSFEMTSAANVQKLLSYNSNIPLTTVLKPFSKMDEIAEKQVRFEFERMNSFSNLYIQDKPKSLEECKSEICRLQDKLDQEYIPIAFDLFEHVTDFQKTKGNLAEDIGKHMKVVQSMAKELNTPLILVAQLNRETMKRKDTRPTMTDIKNAGAYEECADVIISPYRLNYNPEKARARAIKNNDLQQIMTTALAQATQEEDDPYDIQQHYRKEMTVDTIFDFLAEIHILKNRLGGPANIFDYMLFDLNTTAYREITDDIKQLIVTAAPLIEEGY